LECEMFTLPVYENVSLFQNAIQSSYLFLPFLDNTSGESTYESGRYIDIRRQDFVHGKVTIDFNKAYNPYCAYSSGYRCPQPPKENFLDIAIEAGERKYTGPKHQREQDSNMAKNFTEKEKNLILAGHAEEKMYVLQITNEEDSIILRTQSDDIKHNDPLLQVLSGRMLATVRDPEHPGVGIAAPRLESIRTLFGYSDSTRKDSHSNFTLIPGLSGVPNCSVRGAKDAYLFPIVKRT